MPSIETTVRTVNDVAHVKIIADALDAIDPAALRLLDEQARAALDGISPASISHRTIANMGDGTIEAYYTAADEPDLGQLDEDEDALPTDSAAS